MNNLQYDGITKIIEIANNLGPPIINYEMEDMNHKIPLEDQMTEDDNHFAIQKVESLKHLTGLRQMVKVAATHKLEIYNDRSSKITPQNMDKHNLQNSSIHTLWYPCKIYIKE